MEKEFIIIIKLDMWEALHVGKKLKPKSNSVLKRNSIKKRIYHRNRNSFRKEMESDVQIKFDLEFDSVNNVITNLLEINDLNLSLQLL